MKISFTSYNVPEAIKCTKELFKDSSDTPIEGLVNFTSFFVKVFDCKAVNRSSLRDKTALNLHNKVTKKHETNKRQSFFHGYQEAALEFTKFK